MSATIWAIAFFFSGTALYIAGPILLGQYLPDTKRRWLANHYFNTAMLVLDRAVLMARRSGGFALVPTKFDASMEAEKVSIDGVTYHFEDPYNFTARFKKRPFALTDEECDVVINPRLAELGQEYFDFYHENEHVQLDETGRPQAYTTVLDVPKKSRMVDVREARWMVPGSASPKMPESVKDDIEKSQLAYKSRNYIDIMVGLMALGMSFGMVILADYLVGASTSGKLPGINIGLFLGVPF